MDVVGRVIWISGPVVRAEVTSQTQMLEQVSVSDDQLVGEVIGLRRDIATIQVYEDTSGLVPGVPVYGTGAPLSVELGPGLIGGIFDGIQRPLEALAALAGDYIERGVTAPALDRERRWAFTPTATVGERVTGGAVLGTVPETPLVVHRVMVPPDMQGTLTWLAPAGEYTLTTPWHASPTGTRRQRSPDAALGGASAADGRALDPVHPLITGQRVIDALFPSPRGHGGPAGWVWRWQDGASARPGQWSDADIVIYIGCGERGNEMTDVLNEFPKLQDPKTGRPLMERTILIANTSNMPVAAREASIYTGIALAEYYRDMGYHVAVMADSTSRWAEALREISGRLEEMPAEEGFPAYLPSRLASFYERAGLMTTLSGQRAGDCGGVVATQCRLSSR